MKNKKVKYKIIFNEQDEYSLCAVKEIKSLERRKNKAIKQLDFVTGAVIRDIQKFLTRIIKKKNRNNNGCYKNIRKFEKCL